MSGERGDGDERTGVWLLDTVQRVQRTLCEASAPSELGARLPDAFVSGSHHQFAWVAETDGDAIRVRTLPENVDVLDRIDVPVEESATARVQSGAIHVRTDDTVPPEIGAVRDRAGVPPTAASASIPLGDDHGVLHLHTDADVTASHASDVLSTLGETIAERFDALEASRQLDRERRRIEEFRSLVSHDIGNPLNIASGRLELAKDNCDSDHLENATDAMERVDALLDRGLSFVEAGKPPDEQDSVPLATLARECWEDVGEGRGTLVAEDWTVSADRTRLRQLFNELLRNALVHSEGDVRIGVGPLSDGSGFYVADTGPGIPADEHEYVFDLGYTTVPTREGKGLTLVAEIAGAHGWDVRLGPPDADDGARVEILTDTW